MISTPTVRASGTPRLWDRDAVRDDDYAHGLRIVGSPTINDREVLQVRWLVEDWADLFNVRRVALATVVKALAGDDECRDLETLDHLYMTTSHYREAAEWQVAYVLRHLDGSGLAVVRLRSGA